MEIKGIEDEGLMSRVYDAYNNVSILCRAYAIGERDTYYEKWWGDLV